MRGDGNARVEIASCGNDLCATNVWIKDPGGQGEAVGDKLILTLKQDGGGSYTGNAHDARRNMTFSFRMRVERAAMSTSGCVVGGLICKSERWSRLK